MAGDLLECRGPGAPGVRPDDRCADRTPGTSHRTSVGIRAMSEDPHPCGIAAACQPQRPGRRSAREIPDAIAEPDWGGIRVVAALTEDEAALYRGGGEVASPDELLEALLDAFGALDAVIEGNVTTAALRSSEGAFPTAPKV